MRLQLCFATARPHSLLLLAIFVAVSTSAHALTLPGSRTNHGPGSTASQSSTPVWAPDAQVAVDGTFNGNFYYVLPANTPTYAVTHTDSEVDPWWQTQLASNQTIDEIVLYNRLDGGAPVSGRLQDVTITIFDVADVGLTTPLATSPVLNPADALVGPSSIDWDVAGQLGGSVSGGIVRVQIDSGGAAEILSLAEVAIYENDGVEVGPNVALGKSVTPSSTGFGGLPEFVVDGNRDGAFANGSTWHSGYPGADAEVEWIEVDLGALYALDGVSIWSRMDNSNLYGGPIHSVQVEVYDKFHSLVHTSATLNPADVMLNPLLVTDDMTGMAVEGRYVRVVSQVPNDTSNPDSGLWTNAFLSFSELEVFGTRVPEPASAVVLGISLAAAAMGVRRRKS